MNRFLTQTLVLFVIASACPAADFAPGKETRVDFGNAGFKTDRDSLNLPVYVPKDYDPKKAAPLVLFFHGRGGKPDARMGRWISEDKRYIIVGMEFLKNDGAFFQDVDEQVRFNHHVVKQLGKDLKINPRQIFIGGFSQGGFGTALYGFRRSEVGFYRGYLMMAGGLIARGDLGFMKGEPVLVLHGDKDEVVSYNQGKRAAEALHAAGADVTFITQKGIGHTLDREYVPQIRDWLKKQAEDKRLAGWMRKAKGADPGNLPQAIKYYKMIVGAASSDPMVTRAEERLAEIEEQAGEALAAAEEAAGAERYGEAMTMLKKLRRDYKGTDGAGKALEKLRQLNDDPAVAAKAKAEEADARLARAQQLLDGKKYASALKVFDAVAKRYEGTPAAEKALDKAKAMRADAEIMATLRKESAAKDCKRWLAMARNFINSRRPDAAKPYLDKVIKNYPGTSYADEARKMLADSM